VLQNKDGESSKENQDQAMEKREKKGKGKTQNKKPKARTVWETNASNQHSPSGAQNCIFFHKRRTLKAPHMDEKTRKTKKQNKTKERKKKKKKSLTLDPSWTKKFAGSFGDSISSYVSFRSASLLAHQTILLCFLPKNWID
jgi:hypothetical protein